MTDISSETRFRDLADREKLARDAIANALNRYKAIAMKRPLTTAETADQELAQAINTALKPPGKGKSAPHEVCDPLFVAARAVFNHQSLLPAKLLTEAHGELKFDDYDPRALTTAALTLGILMADGTQPPRVRVSAGATVPDTGDAHYGAFTRAFFAAVGEAQGYGPLAEKVLSILAEEGDSGAAFGQSAAPTVHAGELARVLRVLAERKIGAHEPQLRRRVSEALDNVQNIGGEDAIADLSIDLPDFDQLVDQNLNRACIEAFIPMIPTAMFEELKVFQAFDCIVDQFQRGMLPTAAGNAGKLLYRYWRDAPNRLNEQERRNFVAMTLGVPGGDPGVVVNREFNDLWMRFVSSVSSFVRQNEVDALLRASLPSPISQQQVRKAARDLAGNLSLHGYGMTQYAARELQAQLNFMIKVLQDPEILGAFGARDMWQVVDQVATYNLGGAKTSSRYRTLATCGAIITAWLANNVNRINKATGPLIDMEQVRNPDIAGTHKTTRDPTDYDLVNACELWLADTATTDSQIEELSQPKEAPPMTSKPIPIPAMAKEMLDGIGDVGLGLGLGLGASPQHARAGNGYARVN
jgi:hypothetical protein